MKYMGGKNRIAKEILPIILKNRKENQFYVEPFAGGCNVIDKVKGNRLASDKSEYLMEMWYDLTEDHLFIEKIDKDKYDRARTEFNNGVNEEFTISEIGWIGFMASYNGRFFDGGYNGNYKKRDYTKESIDNIYKQIESMKGVEFSSGNYNEIIIPNNSIIYCDIPYEGTKQYATSKNFNHLEFWQWCRDMTKKGNEVFISEYNAPNDFECVWSKEITNSMNTTNTYKPTEKLFTYKI
jgi:DNA adenine methylase